MGKTYIGIADTNIDNPLAINESSSLPIENAAGRLYTVSNYYTYTIVDGCQTATSKSGSSSGYYNGYNWDLKKVPSIYEEQVFYVCIKMKSSSSNTNGYPEARFNIFTDYNAFYNNSKVYYSLSSADGITGTALNDDQWHLFSTTFNNRYSDSINLFDRFHCGMYFTSNREANNVVSIKDWCIINLTEIFGAGNEPTKAWCDEHIVVLDNIVPDGDMESSSWSGGNYSTTEKLFGSRSQYFPANSTTVQTIATPRMPVVGHKYYGRHYLKTDGNVTAADCRFEWYAGDGAGLNYVFGWNQGNYPNWTMESSIVTIDAVNGSSYVCRSFDVNNTGAVWADGLMIVDLTEAFGSGNEPTKQWCDENIPFFTTTKCLFNTDVTVAARARKVKAIYTGINNVARKITSGYIGISSTARKFFGKSQLKWDKYTYKYGEYLSSEGIEGQPGAFYAGTSYTFDETTGYFQVACTTQITNNSSGATNAVGKYFVGSNGTPPTSSGTYSGQNLYLITESHKPLLAALKITYSTYISTYAPDDLIGVVYSYDITSYPINGFENGYYYILQGEGAQVGISYSGSYVDELVQMEDGLYRLLTLTSSGILSLEYPVLADIWICGAGATGLNPGGGGGYCVHQYDAIIQNLLITLGATRNGTGGDAPSYGGRESTVVNDVFLRANGGGNTPYGIAWSVNYNASTIIAGGSGGGGGTNRGVGDGISKLPFDDSYFLYPYCDGGGGGEPAGYATDKGGNGGTNGGSGFYKSIPGNTSPSLGGGHYGGNGGESSSTTSKRQGKAATGYGSGGGGYGVYDDGDSTVSASAGVGYQGGCFIRIPVVNKEYESPTLPTGYTRLEYVESDGHQYIDLGIIPGTYMAALCKFQLVNTSALDDGDTIFGAANFRFYVDTSSYDTPRFLCNAGSGNNFSTILPDTIVHSVAMTRSSTALCTPAYPNSVYEVKSTSEGSSTQTLAIFAFHSGSFNNEYEDKISMKLYSFKLYDVNNLVRDMIPAKNSSNVAGLYDLVNDVFYPSTSGTDLIAGPVVS